MFLSSERVLINGSGSRFGTLHIELALSATDSRLEVVLEAAILYNRKRQAKALVVTRVHQVIVYRQAGDTGIGQDHRYPLFLQ